MRAFFLLGLCKTTYHLEKLFDMFWTWRTSEISIFLFNLKAEQRSQKHDTARLGTYLRSPWKGRPQAPKRQQHPHRFLPWDFTGTREPCIPSSTQQISPLFVGPATGGHWVSVPPQVGRLFCEQCRKTKWLKKGEQKRHIYMVLLISVLILCQGRWRIWESKFRLFSNTVPKSSHSHSCWVLLWAA